MRSGHWTFASRTMLRVVARPSGATSAIMSHVSSNKYMSHPQKFDEIGSTSRRAANKQQCGTFGTFELPAQKQSSSSTDTYLPFPLHSRPGKLARPFFCPLLDTASTRAQRSNPVMYASPTICRGVQRRHSKSNPGTLELLKEGSNLGATSVFNANIYYRKVHQTREIAKQIKLRIYTNGRRLSGPRTLKGSTRGFNLSNFNYCSKISSANGHGYRPR